ncbi:hypothetical protein K458DRAFT_485464 [Lentithecium fluviatile CBS 122367]|uniref:Uncharacterized protein n=1 Tax=Lentithecium fluviatile CBS 122367 TaxID=1168545 RepID=A0A6G1JAE2_9PLEO|nr:hypothetical protein K458DRAFT_485464 [Lentithecium fluviatile CBS 122367]
MMDTSGNKPSGSGSRRSGKKPMQFMFIDSTNHGVNAKPDKAVRSFVMKSARSKKPWSTRQKSPKMGSGADVRSPTEPVLSPTGTHIKAEKASPLNAECSWLEYAPSRRSRSAQSSRSPVSSRALARSLAQPSRPPLSRPATVCNNPRCNGDFCGQPHGEHSALANRNGSDLWFLADFDCSPVRMDGKMRMVIHNFATFYTELFIPLDHHKTLKQSTMKWVRDGMQSTTGAPFIYAALFSGALTPAPGIYDTDRLYYKGQAIRNIQKHLKNPRTRVDDNNITAVFMLLCIEESMAAGSPQGSDEEKETRAHLNGLKMMINHRGGLASLESNPFLQTFIIMHSMAHTVITFERPYTTLVDDTGQVQQYNVPSFRDRPSSARTLRLFQSLNLDSTLLDIIATAIMFVGDLVSASEDPQSPLNPLGLQKHANLLLYRLFDWYKTGEEDRLNERNPVDRSICLALMIFTVIAANTSYDVMVQTAAKKLKASLSQCPLGWGDASDLFMWTAVIGALATHHPLLPKPDFPIFSQYCSRAFTYLGFNASSNTEEVLDRMRKCIWMPKLDKKVKKILVAMGFCLGEEVMETVEYFDDEVSENTNVGLDVNEKGRVVGGLTNGRFFKKSESR